MDKPDERKLQRHVDEGHLALGRYVAEFSRLILVIRDLMVQRLRKADDPPELAELPFGGVTAEPITNAFFAMCRLLMEHDKDEDEVATKLRVAISHQIARRNAVAHGDWYIGYWSVIGGATPEEAVWESSAPRLEQIKPTRRAGPRRVVSEDLDQQSEALVKLRTLARQYGTVCFGRHPRAKRVRDVLVLEDGKAEFGPLASRGPWMV